MSQQILDRRYRITQTLSDDGGFGHTYLAEDTKRPGNPICVVKQLKPQAPDIFAIAKNLFIREAKILEDLGQHSQIPRLLAYFDENEEFYLVQEYIKGETLESKIKNESRLSEEQVTSLLKELLKILCFVHSKNLIHRDIKPANIIIRARDNKPVLIDFGAVKEVSALVGSKAMRIGTRGYAPEEQLFRGNSNFCSDIYALGVTCIHALTGIVPNPNSLQDSFQFDARGEMIWQNKVTIGSDLTNILTKMVRYRAQERYQVVQDILNEPLFTTLKPTTNSTTTFWQKYKLPITLSTVATIAVGGMSLIKSSVRYAPKLSLNGKNIPGELNENSQIEPLKNTYSAVYILDGSKNKQITIELNSSQFDPSLVILTPDLQMLANNDDISPDNFNSKITVTLPENGKYQAIVKASQPGEMGEYQIKASVK